MLDLYDLPVTNANGTARQLLVNLASLNRTAGPAVLTHYNVQPVVDVYASVQGRDLGGVAAEVRKIVDGAQKDLPRGSFTAIRGQVQTMRSSFIGLAAGLALAGIAWMLFLTGTTLSVPALKAAIVWS